MVVLETEINKPKVYPHILSKFCFGFEVLLKFPEY